MYASLVTAGLLAMPAPAQAVDVSANGRGQVLLYPYYTARNDTTGNAYATLLSVVNGTTTGVPELHQFDMDEMAGVICPATRARKGRVDGTYGQRSSAFPAPSGVVP